MTIENTSTDLQPGADQQLEPTAEEIRNPAALLAKNKALLAQIATLKARVADLEGEVQQAQELANGSATELAAFKDAAAHSKLKEMFASSQYIASRLVVPPDMLQAFFGDKFQVRNGEIITLTGEGENVCATADDFDAALESIVTAYPSKDHILKGSTANGMGATGGSRLRTLATSSEAERKADTGATQPTFGLR